MTETPRQIVVLRYRDGRTIHGALTGEFLPGTKEVDVEPDADSSDEPMAVRLDDLKAVFFVKDSKQRTADIGLGGTVDRPGSALARVEFFDGEIMRGVVQNYRLADAGFYLYPTASDSNHRKVFVVAAALTTLAIEG